MGITEFTDLKYNGEKKLQPLILVTTLITSRRFHFSIVYVQSLQNIMKKTPLLPEGEVRKKERTRCTLLASHLRPAALREFHPLYPQPDTTRDTFMASILQYHINHDHFLELSEVTTSSV